MAVMVEGLEARGWACVDGFLDDAVATALLAECSGAWEGGGFRPAAVGRGEAKIIREDIRRDHVMWLDPGTAGPAVRHYLGLLDELRLRINRGLFLGLQDFEGHFAVYPPGAFYKAHLDRHRGTADRVVTAILYLNAGWQTEHGGRLKLWTTPERQDGPYEWIEPRLGTLVIFLSGDHWHEVEVSHCHRQSLTGWLRVAPMP